MICVGGNTRTKSSTKFRASLGKSGKNLSNIQKFACSYTYDAADRRLKAREENLTKYAGSVHAYVKKAEKRANDEKGDE